MNEKQPTSMRIEKTVLNKLDKLMNSGTYNNTTKKIEGCVTLFGKLVRTAEVQLKNYFEYGEVDYLAQMIKGEIIDYNEGINPKDYLLNMYANSTLYVQALVLSNQIDIDRLRNKLEYINEVQAFMIINKLVELWESNKTDYPIKIEDMSIVLDKNIYSIDISFDGNAREVEEINNVLIPYIRKEYTIVSDIILKEVSHEPYNNVTIIVKCNNRMDIISKLELKSKIIDTLKGNNSIMDVNINEIYIC